MIWYFIRFACTSQIDNLNNLNFFLDNEWHDIAITCHQRLQRGLDIDNLCIEHRYIMIQIFSTGIIIDIYNINISLFMRMILSTSLLSHSFIFFVAVSWSLLFWSIMSVMDNIDEVAFMEYMSWDCLYPLTSILYLDNIFILLKHQEISSIALIFNDDLWDFLGIELGIVSKKPW